MKIVVQPTAIKVIRVGPDAVRVVRVNTPARIIRVYWTAGVGPPGPPGAGFAWRGPYNGSTAYVVNDIVEFGGSSWIAIAPSTGQQPDTSPLAWQLLAAEGAVGPQGPEGPPGGGAGTFLALTDTPDTAVQFASSGAFAADGRFTVLNSGEIIVSIGEATPAGGALLELKPESFSGSIPLYMKMVGPKSAAPFVAFEGVSSADTNNNLSTATGWQEEEMIRIRVNGVDRWIRSYSKTVSP